MRRMEARQRKASAAAKLLPVPSEATSVVEPPDGALDGPAPSQHRAAAAVSAETGRARRDTFAQHAKRSTQA